MKTLLGMIFETVLAIESVCDFLARLPRATAAVRMLKR